MALAPRPLGWVLDLDVRGAADARHVAKLLTQLPPSRALLPYRAFAIWLHIHVATGAFSADVMLIIKRCEGVPGHVSVAGTALVARQHWDAATRREIADLARDQRVLERLELRNNDHRSILQ
jgi:hypothetical protein